MLTENKTTMLQYKQILSGFRRKTITKAEMEQLFSVMGDEALYQIVNALVQEQILVPVKASKTNGNTRYPIYLKYKIQQTEEESSDMMEEIMHLHPKMLQTGYLQSKPDIYQKYRDQLQKLKQYLFARKEAGIAISRKERSFEIFGEEKLLDQTAFAHLLEKLGLTADVLGFYDTPAYCFHDYIPVHRENLTLLICENKDIWFNLRRRMFENHARNIFGTRIDGVVYGCGNKVSEPEALTHYTDFLCASVTYLYWGDIDREGLNIYLRLVKNNPQLSVQLFVPAYTEMLHRAQMRTMPDIADHRERMEDYTSVYESFALCERDVFQEIICSNKRVPQEIISYADLEKYMSQE
jgi:hypothetical protein